MSVPANICTTHNEAYRLVHNAVVDSNAEDTRKNVRKKNGRDADEDEDYYY